MVCFGMIMTLNGINNRVKQSFTRLLKEDR